MGGVGVRTKGKMQRESLAPRTFGIPVVRKAGIVYKYEQRRLDWLQEARFQVAVVAR